MNKRNVLLFVILIFSFITTSLFASGTKENPSSETLDQISFKEPKHVFLFIGDGMASSQRQLGELYIKEITSDSNATLIMNSFPVTGMTTTSSEDSLVTDSAASATALATGHKTNSKMVGQTADGVKVKNIVEAARDKGMATGVISNVRITHATPASFLAHNESRYNENEMAVDVLESGATFIAGGGYRHFVPKDGELKSKREDNRDLVAEFKEKGYITFANDVEGFRSFEPEGKVKVFAPLAYTELAFEVDRDDSKEPSLAEMTKKGIQVLKQYSDGFFMMVEGGKIDYASHGNDPVGTVHDVLALDEAVKVAYEFYQENPEDTLIIVVGDHETGGLGLGFKNDYFLKLDSLSSITTVSQNLKYNGDREAFYSFIMNDYGLGELTEEEISLIEKSMDMVDAGIKPDYMSSHRSPLNYTVSNIVSARTGLFWTTYAHTGATVPLTSIGAGALSFSGHKDNTEVALTIAKLLGVSLD